MKLKNLKPGMAALGLVLIAAGNACAQTSSAFVHITTEDNCSVQVSQISNPLTNLKPSSAFMFTHNYSAKGVAGSRHDEKKGLYYAGSTWYVFNQDKSTMDTGLAFNILAPDADTKSWIFTADSSNIVNNYAYIDHPAINGDSSAIIFVSDIWNINGSSKGVYNPNTIGVFYRDSKKKWCVFHQDINKDMVENSSYAVVIPEKSSKIIRFVHKTKPSNIFGSWTVLDHPAANNNPDALIFITQNWNPNGGDGRYNDHEVGAYYTGTQWAIFTEDLTTLDTGLAFNVMIFPNTTANTQTQAMNTQVHFFPNPVTNGDELEVNIQHPSTGPYTLCITDLTGKNWLSHTMEKNQAELNAMIPINGLPKGVYIVQISGESFHSVKRLFVE